MFHSFWIFLYYFFLKNENRNGSFLKLLFSNIFLLFVFYFILHIFYMFCSLPLYIYNIYEFFSLSYFNYLFFFYLWRVKNLYLEIEFFFFKSCSHWVRVPEFVIFSVWCSLRKKKKIFSFFLFFCGRLFTRYTISYIKIILKCIIICMDVRII